MRDFIGEFIRKMEEDDNRQVAMVLEAQSKPKKVQTKQCPGCDRQIPANKYYCGHSDCVPF